MSFWKKLALFLLCLLIFLIPIEHKYDKLFRFFSLKLIPEGLEIPKHFDKKIYFYFSDLLAIFLSLITLFLAKVPLRKFFIEKSHKYLWTVFFLAFLSVLFSPLNHYPLTYIRLLQLLTPVLLFSLVSTLFEKESFPRITSLFLLTFFIAATIQSVFAITQYILQSPLGLRILSEPGSFTAAFTVPSGNRFLFDSFLERTSSSTTIMRVSGTMAHANTLGGFIALSLIGSYPLFLSLKKKGSYVLFSFLIFFQFFALNLTYSRSALFGWALGTFLWFSFLFWKEGKTLLKKNKKARALFFVLLTSLLITKTLLFEQFLYRGGVLNSTHLSQGSNSLRIDYQNTALGILKNHPLLGVGYQQYSFSQNKVNPTPAPHNIFLFLAVETGLLTLLAFLIFLVSLFRKWKLLIIDEKSASLIAISITFLFIGSLDFYPLLFQSGKLMFFMILATLYAHSKYALRIRDDFPFEKRKLENV